MKNYFKTQTFPGPNEAAERLVMDMIRFIENMLELREKLYIALSGGNTPQLMFKIMAHEYASSVPWNKVHFFWVDERCVPATDPESNYGNAHRLLFSKIGIPAENLHPVHGADDPMDEVVRYTGDILSNVPCIANYPSFDLIILGMGDDGHTASIFPGQTGLFEVQSICTISQHPVTKQKRISLTGRVINNATYVVFLVTGKNKAHKLKSVFSREEASFDIPAKKVHPRSGKAAWYLDREASRYIQLNDD